MFKSIEIKSCILWTLMLRTLSLNSLKCDTKIIPKRSVFKTSVPTRVYFPNAFVEKARALRANRLRMGKLSSLYSNILYYSSKRTCVAERTSFLMVQSISKLLHLIHAIYEIFLWNSFGVASSWLDRREWRGKVQFDEDMLADRYWNDRYLIS